MKLIRQTVVLLFALAALTSRCYASGEIVYSARYYNPPGVRGNSHYHIYTIDPDGRHRRQLTFGSQDDYFPVWSPDGMRIAFTRTLANSGNSLLMVCSANGTHLAVLAKRSAFGDVEWESTKSLKFVSYEGNKSYTEAISLKGRVQSREAEQDDDSTKTVSIVPGQEIRR